MVLGALCVPVVGKVVLGELHPYFFFFFSFCVIEFCLTFVLEACALLFFHVIDDACSTFLLTVVLLESTPFLCMVH